MLNVRYGSDALHRAFKHCGVLSLLPEADYLGLFLCAIANT